jgi:microcystin-dependent protein
MPKPPTPRLGMVLPLGDDAPPDIPEDHKQAFSSIDERVAIDDQGPTSARPPATPERKGMYWWSVEEDDLSRCDGTDWHPVGGAGRIPIGGILDWPWASDPPGPAEYIECDGRQIFKGTHPEVFAAAGVTASVMNVPDRRSRSPMGAGQGPGLVARIVGHLVGAQSRAIQKTHLPNYQLSVDDPGHVHASDRPGYRTAQFGNDPNHTTHTGSLVNTQSSKTGITVSLGGGGQSFDLVHPASVTRYFLRVR